LNYLFFLYQAIKNDLLRKENLEKLLKWISEISGDKILENKLRPTFKPIESPVIIEDINLIPGMVELPFFIYEHPSGVWVEIIWEKQQYAYGFQPMVYLCIPHYKFTNQNEWHLPKEELNILIKLFKLFGATSERHRNDVLQILMLLKKIL